MYIQQFEQANGKESIKEFLIGGNLYKFPELLDRKLNVFILVMLPEEESTLLAIKDTYKVGRTLYAKYYYVDSILSNTLIHRFRHDKFGDVTVTNEGGFI